VKTRTRSITFFFAYAVIVAFASLQPGGGSFIGSYDKLAHFLTYGFFAILAHRLTLSGRHYWYLCIGIVTYSGLLEVAQSYVPGREMSALDLLANASGLALGALLCEKIFTAKKSPAK